MMPPRDDESILNQLAQDARWDARMLRPDEKLTPEIAQAIREAARDYYQQRRFRNKSYTLGRLSEECGVGKKIIGRILNGSYDADAEPHLRKLDAFLADQLKREGRFELSPYVENAVVENAMGVIHLAKRQNTIGLIVMESGCGKSTVARAYAAEDTNATLITIEQDHGHARDVVAALYAALDLKGDDSYRECYAAVKAKFRGTRSRIVLIDEAQQLRPSGLEIVRALHDSADPSGRYPLPVVLFADHDFYKLVLRRRSGQSSPIKAQLTSRIAPVYDASAHATQNDGGQLYSLEDVRRLIRHRQVRKVSEAGIRFLQMLANVPDWGRLRVVRQIVSMAYDTHPEGSTQQIGLDELKAALTYVFGPNALQLIDAAREEATAPPLAAVG